MNTNSVFIKFTGFTMGRDKRVMHIPDGYLSPSTYITSYVVTAPFFAYGLKKVRKILAEESLPVISALTALSFLVMMLNIPIPGGTSGHAIGTAVIAILFGPWMAFLSITFVLTIQALVFGDGGITALAVNAFGMGLVAAIVGYYAFQFLSKILNEKIALFIAGWSSIVAAAFILAIVLGIQPLIATDAAGKPLYFPFGLKITIPAMAGSHALYFGIAEGIYTVIIIEFLKKQKIITRWYFQK